MTVIVRSLWVGRWFLLPLWGVRCTCQRDLRAPFREVRIHLVDIGGTAGPSSTPPHGVDRSMGEGSFNLS
jgi:hypothetical protein